MRFFDEVSQLKEMEMRMIDLKTLQPQVFETIRLPKTEPARETLANGRENSARQHVCSWIQFDGFEQGRGTLRQ